MTRAWLGFAAILTAACATATRPPTLEHLEEVRSSPSAASSRATAPQAYAEASRLHEQAEDAWSSGDRLRATELATLAEIAYRRAIVLSRHAQAEESSAQSRKELASVQDELANLRNSQAKLEAEAHDLEMRAKVIQDAEPLAEVGPASPQRENARRQAARALLVEAKLLCLSESLVLGQRAEPTRTLLTRIEASTEALATTPPSESISDARELRAECLRRLGLARRPVPPKSPNAAEADSLLSDLSKMDEFHPFRDDRGVVVLLAAPLREGSLTSDARKALERLQLVAQAHAHFPLLVVLHSAEKVSNPSPSDSALDAIRGVLVPGDPERVQGVYVGNAQPLVVPARQGGDPMNSRLEVIFVVPPPT